MPKAISFLAPGLIVAAAIASGGNLARAQDCPGNPDACLPLIRGNIPGSELWTAQ
jgi:hypothetical protein